MSKIINFQEYKTIFKLSKYIENLLNDSYIITIFNIYGKKIKENLYTNKVDFKKAFLKYSNGKLHSLKSNKFGKIKSKYQIEVYKNKKAIIIPEYSINNSRADYVSFKKDTIDTTIVEIKSSLDNFSRLEKQIKDYYTIAI